MLARLFPFFVAALTLAACSSSPSKNATDEGADPAASESTAEKPQCTVDLDDIKSPLDASSKKFKWLHDEKRDQDGRSVTQQGQYVTGEIVEYAASGCVHLSYSFTFRNAKGLTRGAPNFAIAKKLMQGLPLKRDDYRLTSALDEAASKAPNKDTDGLFILPCSGNAICTLDTRKAGKLQISYGFAN